MALAASNPIPVLSTWEDPLVLLPRRRPERFGRDAVIYRPNDVADSLLLVVDGAVKISRISASGRETILEVEPQESFFGSSCLCGDSHRGEQATALEDTSVMEWSVTELRVLMARMPELGPALMRVLAQKLTAAEDRVEIFATDQIPRRLVKALLRFGERLGERADAGSQVHVMALTHELLAKHVGTSREIVTQHMSRLRGKGLVEYSRAGLDFDPKRLRQELARLR